MSIIKSNVSQEELKELFTNKEKYWYCRSFRLSQAISFLSNTKPTVMLDNNVDNAEKKDENGNTIKVSPKLYFFERNECFNEALEFLLNKKAELTDKYSNRF